MNRGEEIPFKVGRTVKLADIPKAAPKTAFARLYERLQKTKPGEALEVRVDSPEKAKVFKQRLWALSRGSISVTQPRDSRFLYVSLTHRQNGHKPAKKATKKRR